MSRVNHEIALKKPESRTTWDLLQVFFATVKCGSYKKAADYLLISPQAVCMALHDLESRLSQKIITHLPKNNMEIEKYPAPLMTSEGAKWYLVVSELTNKENIEERLSYFKRESMMPFGFEPIAYNMWQDLGSLSHTEQISDPSYTIITIITIHIHGGGTMKPFKILTLDSFAHYMIASILPKLIFKYPHTLFCVEDATIDRSDLNADFYLLPYMPKNSHYLSESIVEGKMCLYANGSYLERKGIPKTLNDLLHHNIIRPKRSDVLLNIAKEDSHGNPYHKHSIYYKKEAIEVDNLTSLLQLGDSGAGIICSSDKLDKWHPNLKMERLPDLSEISTYVSFMVGVHEKEKNNPIFEDLRREVKSILLN